MVYNLTLINTTGMLTFTQTVNTQLMSGLLGTMFLVALFFITFISFSNRNVEFKSAFAYSFTIIAIMALPFRVLDLVNDVTVWAVWIMLGLSMMMIFFTD